MIDQSNREARARIARPATGIVDLDSMFEVDRPTGVVTPIGTFNDIGITGQSLPQPVIKTYLDGKQDGKCMHIGFYYICENPSIR
jgi:hypothetical protein